MITGNKLKRSAHNFLLIAWVLSCLTYKVAAQEDFEALYKSLRSKIEAEWMKPGGDDIKNIEAYLQWMRIKAGDRDNARAISLRANKAGNPYWENKFIELALMAQQSGEVTVWSGASILMGFLEKVEPIDYTGACFKAGKYVGERLYLGAMENGFSTEDIVAIAQCLMRYATNNLESKWLYYGNEAFAGRFDEQGNRVLPPGDWNEKCLRRGEFTTTNRGEPVAPADKAMKMTEMVREICEFYHLNAEYGDATDLMNQYLTEKEVLCLKPPMGHQWFDDLAEEYKLDKSKEHIKGFYAVIKGRVEKNNNGIFRPVAGAEVEYEAPDDQKIWKTYSDAEGNYRIDSVLLHKNCGPFVVSARSESCYGQEEVPGPLDEPDRDFQLEKNIVLECGITGYSGTITVTKSWDYTKHYDNYSETYIGTQKIVFKGTFKPIKELEDSGGQPIRIYGADRVTGTWKHNEDRICEGSGGCGKCTGLVYQEYGMGRIPSETLSGLRITTYIWPTAMKEVAKQLKQFGFENWYIIATPTETVASQTRLKNETQTGCEWSNSTSSAVLTGSDLRYKIEDPDHLKGRISWSSSRGTTGISVTNMPEAEGAQKPFSPEKNGSDYTYAIDWNLNALTSLK